MATLLAKNLRKSYWQSNREIPVLSGVSLELQAGQSLAVTGSSGIGKSTLLHCLGLLDSVDSGEIYFDGELVSKSSSNERVLRRRRSIGFVFQFHYLMSELSALENVMVPLLLNGQSKKTSQEKAEDWLTKVGLKERVLHRPQQLSGGELQRVAIARALALEPKIILADEPTGNLDPETAKSVFNLLVDQCKNLQAVLVMATHNHELSVNLDRKVTVQRGTLTE